MIQVANVTIWGNITENNSFRKLRENTQRISCI